MDRMACINFPDLPVQLLLRRNPTWRNLPVAVVDADKPEGIIQQVNAHARRFRIAAGMRYAAGLALSGSLRAAVVSDTEIKKAIDFITKRLLSYSPRVEPAIDEPGVFWSDASGLDRLFKSLIKWALRIQSDMSLDGFRVTVVVGFSRFGSYALAKARREILVLKNPHEEQSAARSIPIDRLALEPEIRDLLAKLGIQTVGQFIQLPADGVTKRFGQKTRELHRFASGELNLPLQPEKPLSPATQRLVLDYPEIDMGRLMAIIERLLRPLLQMLTDRAHALSEVQIRFCFARIAEHMEHIRPAAPTCNVRRLLELIRLRLQSVNKLAEGVTEIALVGQSVPAIREQQLLFETKPKRNLAAANRALARVRAELGDEAVVRARLCDGHLPEGRFTWETFVTLSQPRPDNGKKNGLIRRIHTKPIPLPFKLGQATDKTLKSGLTNEWAERLIGPYIISGGWWRQLVHRDYYFCETRRGEMLWVYYDQVRKRWFLHGRIE
jgi:protein ImuB